MMIIFGHSHSIGPKSKKLWYSAVSGLQDTGPGSGTFGSPVFAKLVHSLSMVSLTFRQIVSISLIGDHYLFVLLSDKWTWDTGEEVEKIVRMAGA